MNTNGVHERHSVNVIRALFNFISFSSCNKSFSPNMIGVKVV